jgi:hypothetical protein
VDVEPGEVETLLGEAISNALPEALITRWVTCVELIDSNGERALYLATSEDLSAWDSLGILDYAATRERAAIHRDTMDDGA